jgi:hypothetical protein
MSEGTKEPTIKFPPVPSDRRGCPGNLQPHNCPNMVEVGGDWNGERYRCDVCNEGFYIDYDEMK